MEDNDISNERAPIDGSSLDWDKVVVFTLGGDRHMVRDLETAYRSLTELWSNKRGPSYRRAVDTSEAALAGERPGSAARITFVVALMEAGLPFQLYDDEISMLEDEVAMISRNMASNDG